jgi:hypothetical protein
MPGPFAAYPGYSAKLQLGPIRSGPGSLIAIPATEWFFPERRIPRTIYSSAGGLFCDSLPANYLPSDLIVAGTFRSDYNPFVNLPLGLGTQIGAALTPNSATSDPAALVPALVTLLDVRAIANVSVAYIIGLRALWRWQSFTGRIPGY